MSPNSIILFTLLLFYLIVLKETNMLYKNKITQCFTQLHPPLWCQNFFYQGCCGYTYKQSDSASEISFHI